MIASGKRATYWTGSFRSKDYGPAAMGWKYTAPGHGKAGEADETARAALYDTTQRAYGNGGHTFGDVLTDEERAALLEYLKTL